MALVGNSSAVYVSGTSTSFTGLSLEGETTHWYSGDSTKNVWDPTVEVLVYDDAVEVDAATTTVNFLQGSVTTPSISGTITADGNYLPLLQVGEVRSFTLNLANKLEDKTVFGESSRTRLSGLKEFSGSFEMLVTPDSDLDSGGDTRNLFSDFTAGTSIVLKLILGTQYGFLGWIKISDFQKSTPVDGLVTYVVNFQSHSVSAASTGTGAGEFSSYHLGTIYE